MTHVTIPNRPLGTDQRSIEYILSDFDAITGVINGGLDDTNFSPSFYSEWNTYTPLFTANNGGWVDGSTITKIGKYLQIGKTCWVRIYFNVGSGGSPAFNGGAGGIVVTLPVGSVNDSTEQDILAKLFTSVSSSTWAGIVSISPGTAVGNLAFTLNSPGSMFPLCNSPGGGAIQCPPVGNYPLQPGSVLVVQGSYQTA